MPIASKSDNRGAKFAQCALGGLGAYCRCDGSRRFERIGIGPSCEAGLCARGSGESEIRQDKAQHFETLRCNGNDKEGSRVAFAKEDRDARGDEFKEIHGTQSTESLAGLDH